MPTSISRAGFGLVGSAVDAQMRAALRLYDADQVVEAAGMIADAGIGNTAEFLNDTLVIQAEAQTSTRSIITRVNEWLEVEQIQTEQPLAASEIGAIAEEAIQKTFRTIGVRTGSNVLVTLLANDVTLPAHLAHTGYIVAKDNFAKYCMPSSASSDNQVLGYVVQCLAACHATALLSNSMAPSWVIGASQAITEMPVPPEVRAGFCMGRYKWLEPGALGAVLGGLHSANQESGELLAINQAVLVGKFLIKEAGIATFRDLITYFSPASLFHYMKLLLSSDPTRDACKHLYGVAPEYLFEHALAACCK